VPISSRHYNIKNHKLVFAKADDAQTREFMQAKVFWLAFTMSGEKQDAKVWVGDVYDADYMGTPRSICSRSRRHWRMKGY